MKPGILDSIDRYTPPALEDRAPFEWEVPIGMLVVGRNNPKVQVEAVETCCEYLYAHESVGTRTGYTVSHKLTGYAIIWGIPTLRDAQYIAGALKPLFRWSEDHGPYYKARRRELDKKLWNWIEAWRNQL